VNFLDSNVLQVTVVEILLHICVGGIKDAERWQVAVINTKIVSEASLHAFLDIRICEQDFTLQIFRCLFENLLIICSLSLIVISKEDDSVSFLSKDRFNVVLTKFENLRDRSCLKPSKNQSRSPTVRNWRTVEDWRLIKFAEESN
jgi:hypothetical protein